MLSYKKKTCYLAVKLFLAVELAILTCWIDVNIILIVFLAILAIQQCVEIIFCGN